MKHRQLSRPLPRALLLTGALWLFFSVYLLVFGSRDMLEQSAEFPSPIFPVWGLICLIGAVGLLLGRAFARGFILFAAGLGLIAAAAFLVTVRVPSSWLWWALLLLAIFFAWSLFFVVALWSKRQLSEVAG